jgi:hypothetical protein
MLLYNLAKFSPHPAPAPENRERPGNEGSLDVSTIMTSFFQKLLY